MSSFLQCVCCKEVGDQTELGHLTHNGKIRHLYRCSLCDRVWEKVTSNKPVTKTDPVLKILT